MTPFEMLEEFHRTYGVAINVPITRGIRNLRCKLMNEELDEVEEELMTEIFIDEPMDTPCKVNKKKLTKELADLMYVTIGCATTFGLPLEAVFAEVHKSNMSKLGDDGKPIYREDGKVLKGPNYKEPNLDRFF